MASRYVVEHLNHLGIVAQVCHEIAVADWLDQQEPGNRQQVSVGMATVALVLNGLGFSNRRLYLVPQFFADKPVDHLLGPGIMAEDLNDDCLGRTLDWLYEHDVTRLFAGLALRARATVQRQAERDQQTWEQRLWHLGNQTFACRPDAEAALAKACQRVPPWFVVQAQVNSQRGYAARGRPRTGATPTTQTWQIQATLTPDPAALEREALRRAAFLVGTNLLDRDAWPDEAVIALYREQTVVEMDCTQMTSFVGHGTLISH